MPFSIHIIDFCATVVFVISLFLSDLVCKNTDEKNLKFANLRMTVDAFLAF